jgi:thiamine-monophosphate kinase
VDVSGRGEFAAIARLAARLPHGPDDEVWIGDDAAVMRGGIERLLLTTDAVVGGVHADLALVSLADFGWKALAVNVSDIAAMGGQPVAAVVAVAGPPSTDLDALYEGLGAAATRWGCPIVGGDLVESSALVVTVTVAGQGDGQPPPVTRAGARPGDTLMVTGSLGASAAGLRLLRAGVTAGPLIAAYRRPQARLAEGQAARAGGASAMIDVSDGFGADVGHLLDASEVGSRLGDLPIAPGATEDEALAGGEDYELVFSAPDPERVGHAFAAAGLPAPIVVGVCTEDPAERTLGGQPLAALGWEHRWS